MAFVARRPFRTADALIVVSSDGYFDVFPPTGRQPNDRPNYRGVVSELGATVRGTDGGLGVRPDSVALDAAVSVWSRSHGAAAVNGDMGLGRNESKVKPAPAAAPAAPAAPAAAAAADTGKKKVAAGKAS
jgi:hypothetical protein